eukprot:scaffold648236_cov47-Prasinocladus_malaysianus.AAC.1
MLDFTMRHAKLYIKLKDLRAMNHWSSCGNMLRFDTLVDLCSALEAASPECRAQCHLITVEASLRWI